MPSKQKLNLSGNNTEKSNKNLKISIRGGTAKRKRDESDGEQAGTSKEQRKKAKREKGEKLPPLPTDLIQKMKALIDYIVEYEDK